MENRKNAKNAIKINKTRTLKKKITKKNEI